MQQIPESFPPFWTMISVDWFVAVLAVVGTIIVARKWRMIRKAGGAIGITTVLTGLWLGALLYLADLYTMTVLPSLANRAETMEAMHLLHLNYSWYINATASLLIFVGLITTITQFSNQLRIVEEKSQALEESETLLESVFENIPVGLLIKDLDQAIERANNTYLNWYGLQPADIIGRRGYVIENFQSSEDLQEMEGQEREVVEGSGPQTRQVERRFADGRRHIVKITKFPVYDHHGAVTKVGSVSVDLTELVEATRQAEFARGEAEAANRQKSVFLANMSRELRTPLNAIIGFSETMTQQIFGPLGSEKYQQHAEAIFESGNHLLDLVNDILELSKFAADEYELSPVPFDLSGTVAGVLQIVQSTAERKRLGLVNKLPDAPLTIVADKRAIKQILLNLIANAVKFTPEDGTVTVGASDSQGDLVLYVEDTGIGIHSDDIPQLTNPFNQGSNPSAYTSEEGTGLGLSIVASIVRLHGGELEIKSNVGTGTHVSVFLPGVFQDVKRSTVS